MLKAGFLMTPLIWCSSYLFCHFSQNESEAPSTSGEKKPKMSSDSGRGGQRGRGRGRGRGREPNVIQSHSIFEQGPTEKTIKSGTVKILGACFFQNYPYFVYRNDPKFFGQIGLGNSADPDQTAPRGAV